MKMRTLPAWQGILLKALALTPVFLVLHYASRWLPTPWIAWFSGTHESVFEHTKITFFAYMIVCVVEYALQRRNIPNVGRFFYSRLALVVLIPWLMMILWYIAPAITARAMPSDLAEIIYANITLLLIAGSAGVLERSLEQHDFTRPARVVLVSLFGVFLVEAIIFSYRLPWADLFATP